MIRFPKESHLPTLPNTEPYDSYPSRLRKRLSQLFTEVRLVTHDIQSPPVLLVSRQFTQSLSAGTPAVVQLVSETHDTHGEFDPSTYRWTPIKTGYYRVSWSVAFLGGAATDNACESAIQRSGIALVSAHVIHPLTSASSAYVTAGGSAVIHMSGSDYLEVVAEAAQACSIPADESATYLSAEFVGGDAIA